MYSTALAMADVFVSAPVVSTMTITSKLCDPQEHREFLLQCIANIPFELADASDLDLPVNSDRSRKKHTKKPTIVRIPTAGSWRGERICMPIRLQPHVGRRGCGEGVHGNFRNCVPYSVGKKGAKIFVSGTVQAWGFRSLDEFHEFMQCVLSSTMGGKVDAASTRVALSITDAKLAAAATGDLLPLRELAVFCQGRLREDEGAAVLYSPNDFPGLKLSLPHPSAQGRKVSVKIHERGSVKVYVGTPKPCDVAAPSVWERLGQIFEEWRRSG